MLSLCYSVVEYVSLVLDQLVQGGNVPQHG